MWGCRCLARPRSGSGWAERALATSAPQAPSSLNAEIAEKRRDTEKLRVLCVASASSAYNLTRLRRSRLRRSVLALGHADDEAVELVRHLDLARQPRVRFDVFGEVEH